MKSRSLREQFLFIDFVRLVAITAVLVAWLSAFAGCAPVAPSMEKGSFNPQTKDSSGQTKSGAPLETLGQVITESFSFLSEDSTDALTEVMASDNRELDYIERETLFSNGQVPLDLASDSPRPSQVVFVLKMSQGEIDKILKNRSERGDPVLASVRFSSEMEKGYFILRSKKWPKALIQNCDRVLVVFPASK